MDSVNYFKSKISPIDCAVEWVIKGMNIGLIYGLCLTSQVEKVSNPYQYNLNKLKFIGKNSLYTGAVLGTWWFFNKLIERIIEKDIWVNYSISAAIVVLLLHKPLEIPSTRIKSFLGPAIIIGGVLGKISTSQN